MENEKCKLYNEIYEVLFGPVFRPLNKKGSQPVEQGKGRFIQ